MPTESGEPLSSAINDQSSLGNADLLTVLKGMYSEIQALQQSGSGVFFTVALDGSGNYNVSPTATDTNVQINQALALANALGGGTVLVKAGTFVISNRIEQPSNTKLIGLGIGVTTIKAVAQYNPTAGPSGGRAMLVAKTDPVSNILCLDMSWDGNGQNISGLTSDSTHRLVDIYHATNIHFENCEIKNVLNWATCFWGCNHIWVERNQITTGWSDTLNQQDGIHLVNPKHFHVNRNFVDTYSGGAHSSGDDAIVIQSYGVADGDSAYGEVTENTATSNRFGIKLVVGTNGTTACSDITDVIVSDNVIHDCFKGAVKLDMPVSTVAKFRRVKVVDNDIYNFGIGNIADGEGIHLNVFTTASLCNVSFYDLDISGNTIRKGSWSSGSGINIEGKGYGLKVNDNQMSELYGLFGIRLGSASNPIKDYECNDNIIDVTLAGSNVKGLQLYGTERGNAHSNKIYGHTTGTTYGITLEAAATAGNDSEGVARAEVSAYNLVALNHIYNFDNGVAEINAGANPNSNTILSGMFASVATWVTLLGAASRWLNSSSSPRFILGLQGMSIGGAASQVATSGRVVMAEIQVVTPVVVDQIAWTNGSAVSGNVTVGIYGPLVTEETAAGAPVVAQASVAQAGVNVPQAVSVTPVLLQPGRYYVGLEFDNATSTYQRHTGTNMVVGWAQYYDRSGGYGAYTDPCPTPTSDPAQCPIVRLRCVV